MSIPNTPPPPRHLLMNQERAVHIDTEGGMCFLHPQRLNSLDPVRHPFPGDVTNTALVGEMYLAATWVERDLSLARLALIDLREPIQSGIEMSDLRVASDGGTSNHHHVAGAVWSHILDAEPLAICEHNGEIVSHIRKTMIQHNGKILSHICSTYFCIRKTVIQNNGKMHHIFFHFLFKRR